MLVIQIAAAQALLPVTLTMALEKQVAELEDFRVWDRRLALSLEIVKSNQQNWRKIEVVINARK